MRRITSKRTQYSTERTIETIKSNTPRMDADKPFFYESETDKQAVVAILAGMGGSYWEKEGIERVYWTLEPSYPLTKDAPKASVYYDLTRGLWGAKDSYFAMNRAYYEMQEAAFILGRKSDVYIRPNVMSNFHGDWRKCK